MRSFKYIAFIAFLLAGATVNAAPFPLAVAASSGATGNVAYTYTTGNDLSGLGKSEFVINTPGPGVYLVTFAANFAATGSAAKPTIFACVVNVLNVRTVAEATAFSETDSSWYIGVSGSGIANVTKAHPQLGVVCGSGDNRRGPMATARLK